MKRERKLRFDPKAFLSKVNGGRAISYYRKDQNVCTQGESADYPSAHAGFKAANDGVATRTVQHLLGHKNCSVF